MAGFAFCSVLLAFCVLLFASGSRVQAGGVNGGTNCAACTIVVGLVEQLSEIHNETVDKAMERLCQALPKDLQPACDELINLFGPTIIELLENKETPDVVCHAIDMCTGPCRLFPAPTEGLDFAVARAKEALLVKKLSLPAGVDICKIPIVSAICDIFNNFGNNHTPILDMDGDGFSPVSTFRGADWRGRDCNDEDPNVYPGRTPINNDIEVDSNCNGIYGVDPATSTPFEELYCSGIDRHGIIALGDSATAHFHVPPQWMEALSIDNTTYEDLLFAASNELDWPMLSATTAFVNTTQWQPSIIGPSNSSYMLMRNRNLCMHRDYQNIGVNGARVGSMNDSIVEYMSRNPLTDTPATVMYALIGNDVCNGHNDTLASMTTVADFQAAVLSTMEYLDTRLPAGSHVVMMALADGRILYEALANRTHPLGQYRNDVTYATVYDFLNCLLISPCSGWMNSNATLRNLTTEHAELLSEVLYNVSITQKYQNFDTYFIENPIGEAIQIWNAQGGQTWQLIEPVDGFHPNQYAQPLVVDVVWQWFSEQYPQLLPPINPHNSLIAETFGNQGGH